MTFHSKLPSCIEQEQEQLTEATSKNNNVSDWLYFFIFKIPCTGSFESVKNTIDM